MLKNLPSQPASFLPNTAFMSVIMNMRVRFISYARGVGKNPAASSVLYEQRITPRAAACQILITASNQSTIASIPLHCFKTSGVKRGI
jgi:hypothetical protein